VLIHPSVDSPKSINGGVKIQFDFMKEQLVVPDVGLNVLRVWT
jgi:hypothetical protein